MIKKFITDDKRVGYDEFNQLMLATRDGDNTSYHMISDLRRQKCALCLRGWEATGESLADQTHWRLTDAYVHQTCLMRHIGFVERSEIYDAVCGARLRFGGLVPIENRYWPKAYPESTRPWYETKLLDYPVLLTVGHRKNVIEITVEGDWLPSEALREAFEKADVTKEFAPKIVLIHAWGNEKMREYLTTIAKVLKEKGADGG